MVKLLKLLPEEAMLQQLPSALQGVAHLLRNRLQRIRWVLPPCQPTAPILTVTCSKRVFLPPCHQLLIAPMPV